MRLDVLAEQAIPLRIDRTSQLRYVGYEFETLKLPASICIEVRAGFIVMGRVVSANNPQFRRIVGHFEADPQLLA